jgi:hypothetical protein
MVAIHLKDTRLHAAHDLVHGRADVELDLYDEISLVDRVQELRLVDLAKRLVVQTERQGIEQCRLASTVLTYDECSV